MAGKKQKKPVAAEPQIMQDPLKLIQNNIKPISIIVIAALVITIVILSYTNYTESQENDSWQALNDFQMQTMRSLTVDQSAVQEFLSEIEGTSAEPYALAYCTDLYFNKRKFDQASKMLDLIDDKYKNHYLCKNTPFYKEARTKIAQEIEWLNKNKPEEPEPSPAEENT